MSNIERVLSYCRSVAAAFPTEDVKTMAQQIIEMLTEPETYCDDYVDDLINHAECL